MAALATYQLPLVLRATRLSDVYGGTPGTPDPDQDVPYRWFVFQAETADVYIGDAGVTINKYGVHLGVTTLHDATGHLGPFDSGAVRLSDFYACGPNAILHITGLKF